MSRQQTIERYQQHSKHVAAWLYGSAPHTPCPCAWCYSYQQDQELIRRLEESKYVWWRKKDILDFLRGGEGT